MNNQTTSARIGGVRLSLVNATNDVGRHLSQCPASRQTKLLNAFAAGPRLHIATATPAATTKLENRYRPPHSNIERPSVAKFFST
jgi:predicted anti-sigma-YlaC factor YlaD